MKNKKLFSILGVAALLVAGNFAKQEVEVVDAATEKTIYLTPNSNWTQANAWFAARVWNDSGAEKWYKMTDDDGDGTYEANIETTTYPKVIFTRMDPGKSKLDWSSKWNQTGDLTFPTDSKNLFTVKSGTWDGATTSWGTYTYKAPEYNLMGTMTNWDSGTKMTESNKVYTLTVEDVPVGTQQFKLKTGDSWFGYSNFTVNGIEVTQGQGGDWDNCIFESEGGNYIFKYTLSTKTLNITHVSYAELNEELGTLLSKYYNNGSYTRETTINLTTETAQELVSCFHAGNIVANRTTVFEGGSLWMTNEAKTYSYYGTSGEDMTGGRVTTVGETVTTVAKAGVGGMEGYYTTMNDIKGSTNVKWTKTGSVWSCTDDSVIQQFLDFTAPCFLGVDEAHKNYFTLSGVEVEETSNGLELRLVCSKVETGKFEEGSGNVLSKAVITF